MWWLSAELPLVTVIVLFFAFFPQWCQPLTRLGVSTVSPALLVTPSSPSSKSQCVVSFTVIVMLKVYTFHSLFTTFVLVWHWYVMYLSQLPHFWDCLLLLTVSQSYSFPDSPLSSPCFSVHHLSAHPYHLCSFCFSSSSPSTLPSLFLLPRTSLLSPSLPPPCSVREKFVEVDLKPVCKHCYERLPDDMKRRRAKRERDSKEKKKKLLIPMCLWPSLSLLSSLQLFLSWSVSIFLVVHFFLV